jgi:hypothetical protein
MTPFASKPVPSGEPKNSALRHRFERRLDKTILRAPADGAVTVIVAEVGENVRAGQPVRSPSLVLALRLGFGNAFALALQQSRLRRRSRAASGRSYVPMHAYRFNRDAGAYAAPGSIDVRLPRLSAKDPTSGQSDDRRGGHRRNTPRTTR